jgi:hypothetical protein
MYLTYFHQQVKIHSLTLMLKEVKTSNQNNTSYVFLDCSTSWDRFKEWAYMARLRKLS